MVSKERLNTWSAEIAESWPTTDPKSLPKRPRVDPKSNPSRPETAQRRPGHPLGDPKRRKLENAIFEEKGNPKRTPFGIDFASFHCMKLTKQGFGGIATTRAHVKKVAFSNGSIENIAKRCPRRASGEIGPSATYLCKTKKIKCFSRGDLVALAANFAFSPP